MWVFLFQPRRGYISCGGFFLDPNEIFFSAGCTFHPRRGLKPRQGGHRVPTRCETSARWPRGHPKWPRVEFASREGGRRGGFAHLFAAKEAGESLLLPDVSDHRGTSVSNLLGTIPSVVSFGSVARGFGR